MTKYLAILLLCFPFFVHASFFPQAGKVLIYKMVHSPVDPADEDTVEGEFALEALSSNETADGLVTHFKSYSSTFPKPQFFDVIENKDSVNISGITFIGPGSDEVMNDQFTLFSKPLNKGDRQDFPLMLSEVKEAGTLEILGQVYPAQRISLIGTYGHYYTMAGDYWLVDGLGMVKAVYTTVDGHNVELDLIAIQ